MVKFSIQKDAEAPVPKRGRRLQWTIPLDEIVPGATMTLEMGAVEARDRINAVRSFVSREQKKMGLKFSVYLSDAGIVLFRRSEDE